MLYPLRSIINILFPLTSHGRLLQTYTPAEFLRYYQPTRIDTHIALSHYHKPVVQAAVAACKFENSDHAARLLATLVTQWFREHPTDQNTLIVPIPLGRQRTKERHFNQVTRVLSYSTLAPTIKINEGVLVRTVDTARQTSLNRQARLENMLTAFVVTTKAALIDWRSVSRIVICDDVTTTGATLAAAKTALRPHLPPHTELITLAWTH
jgi:predicted amidophosphoribosyltransferase